MTLGQARFFHCFARLCAPAIAYPPIAFSRIPATMRASIHDRSTIGTHAG